MLQQILVFAQNLLETTKGGLIAGVGVVVLIWSALSIFGQIENAFNRIWNIQKGRRIGRKFSDYLSVMLVFPIGMILSSSITVYLTAQAAVLSEKTALLDAVSVLLFFMLKLLPYLILWAFFSFIYIFMPNRKIPYASGILAGIFAGTLYQAVQWTYITLQVGVAKYNAIYGSFAALPLFLIWLKLSWSIVLFGAELSYSHHNYAVYRVTPGEGSDLSPEAFKLMALQVTHRVVQDFKKGKKAPSTGALSERLGCPPHLVKSTLDTLLAAGILSEVRAQDDGTPPAAYQPGCDTDLITIGFVLEALDRRGSPRLPFSETAETRCFRQALAAFSEVIRRCPENKKLKEI